MEVAGVTRSSPQSVQTGAAAPVRARQSPWVVMGVVLMGAYPFVLNMTVLAIALPQIDADLGAGSVLGVDWIVTSYLLAVTAVQPGTAWMADRWGRRRVYAAAMVVFAVGTVLAGGAPSMEMLVLGRVIQGFGGGVLMPVGMTMIYEAFPPERRGFALGIWGVAIMAGPALGPPLGGWVISQLDWRLMFWGILPLLAVAFALAVWRLEDVGHREHRPIDAPGWAAATVGIVAMVIAARQATNWGYASVPTLTALGVGVVALVLFGLHVRTRHDPVLDLGIFRERTFGISMAIVAFLTVTQYARLTFLPVELQFVQDHGPATVGLLLVPGALGVAATMPVGGWVTDRVGPRVPVVVGLALNAVGAWLLAHMTPETTIPHLLFITVLSGTGTGLAMLPNDVAAMNSLPARFVAQASVVRSLNRQIWAAMGTAMLAALVVMQLTRVVPTERTRASVLAAQDAYNDVFLIAFFLTLVGMVLALFLPGRALTQKHQMERRVEYDEQLRGEAG